MAKTRRSLTAEEREARRAAQRELVRASIEQLCTSDGWQAYLKARRRFPSYSWGEYFLDPAPTTRRHAGRGVPHMAGSRLQRPHAPRRRPRGRLGDSDLGALRAEPQAAPGVARSRRRPRGPPARDVTARIGQFLAGWPAGSVNDPGQRLGGAGERVGLRSRRGAGARRATAQRRSRARLAGTPGEAGV